MEPEKEYMTMEEAAAYIGLARASIYNYINDLKIVAHKFGRDRRSYLAMSDVKLLKEYKEKPWMVEKRSQEKKDAIEGADLSSMMLIGNGQYQEQELEAVS
jgi:excisionase family DNA binding protein